MGCLWLWRQVVEDKEKEKEKEEEEEEEKEEDCSIKNAQHLSLNGRHVTFGSVSCARGSP